MIFAIIKFKPSVQAKHKRNDFIFIHNKIHLFSTYSLILQHDLIKSEAFLK